MLCRHLALCVDPDGTIHPLDPAFLATLDVLAEQVELVTSHLCSVREHLQHRLAVCTRELITGATGDPRASDERHRPSVKRWVLACGELVADACAATLAAAIPLPGTKSPAALLSRPGLAYPGRRWSLNRPVSPPDGPAT